MALYSNIKVKVAVAFLCLGFSVAMTPGAALSGGALNAPPSRVGSPRLSGLLHMRPWIARKLYRGARRNSLPTSGVITNIVVLIMENRSLDDLFAGWYGQPYGSSGQKWSQRVDLANPGGTPALSQVNLEKPGDPDHSHFKAGLGGAGFGLEYDDGAQDKWSLNPIIGCSSSPCSFDVHAYVSRSETSIYAGLASQYALDDEAVQGNQGQSFIAHQYLIAGQSGGINEPGSVRPPYAMADNPGGLFNAQDSGDPYNDVATAYCSNYTGPKPVTIDMTQSYDSQLTAESTNPNYNPCQDYQTIFDRLAQQIVPPFESWEYHTDNPTSFWAAPMVISHLAPQGVPAGGGARPGWHAVRARSSERKPARSHLRCALPVRFRSSVYFPRHE